MAPADRHPQAPATTDTSKQHGVREETIEHHFHAGHAGALDYLPCQRDAIAWWLPPCSAAPAQRGSNSTQNESESEQTVHTVPISTPMFKCVLTLVVGSLVFPSVAAWTCSVLCCVLHLPSAAWFVHVEQCYSMAGKE